MKSSDRELLERFAEGHDEGAFRALVERHLAVVHGVARRVTASEDLAKDVAQACFIRLAQRAASIPQDVALAGWLHRVAHHLAIDLVRAEERRRQRELAIHPHPSAMDGSPLPDWSSLAPLIDSLVDRLPRADREVLLMRYYRNEPHAAVARQLGLSEAAAKKRATRALGKLRGLLGKKGIATSTAALASLLPAHAATAPPASLTLAVTAATRGIAPVPLQGFDLHLAMTTAQKSAVAGAAMIFMVSLGYAVRSSSPPPASSATPASSSPGSGRSAATALRTRSDRSGSLSAEDRLERLRQILAIPVRAEQLRQSLAFIDGLEPDQFAEIAGHFAGLGVLLHQDVPRLLLAAWVKVDPLRTMAWTAGDESKEGQRIALKAWGEIDAGAAVAWEVANAPGVTGADWVARTPLIDALAGLAARDMKAAIHALRVIPDEANRTEALQFLLQEGTTFNEVTSFERLLAALDEDSGVNRAQLTAWHLQSLAANGQGARAVELLLSDEEVRKATQIDQLFASWQRKAPQEALSQIRQMPAGEVQDQAITSYCLAAVNRQASASFALIREYPGAATDITIAKMAGDCAIEDVGLAAEQILHMQDPALREEALGLRLRWWLGVDVPGARRWIAAHPVPQAVLDTLPAATSSQPKKP